MSSSTDNSENSAVSNHITSYWNSIYRKEVPVRGIKTTYLEAGEGPSILLVHGFSGAKNHWRSVMMGLKRHFHVVAVEVPGFNLTQWLPGEKHSLRYLTDWMDAFASAIQLKEFHIVGFSAGACLGAYYAFTHPDKVLSLSFISFPNVYFEEEQLYKNVFDECLYTQIQCAKDVDGLWSSLFYEPPQVPNFFQHIFYNVLKYRMPALRRILQDLSDGATILMPRLRHIKCAVLAIRGDHDENSSPEIAAYLSRTVPRIQLAEIKNAKHLCYVERYKETISLLTTFFYSLRDVQFAEPGLIHRLPQAAAAPPIPSKDAHDQA